MAFNVKDWLDSRVGGIRVKADELEDMETRLSDYTDERVTDVAGFDLSGYADGDVPTFDAGSGTLQPEAPSGGTTQAELDAHVADTTSVHGITDTANLAELSGDSADDAYAFGAGTGVLVPAAESGAGEALATMQAALDAHVAADDPHGDRAYAQEGVIPPYFFMASLRTHNTAVWRLLEPTGTVAADSQALVDGVYTGGVTLGQAGPGPTGFPAASFDGTDDVVQIPDPGTLLKWTGTQECTIQAWVNPTDTTGLLPIFGKGAGDHVYFYLNNAKMEFGRSAFEVMSTGPDVPVNVWTHVAAVRDAASNVSFYRNGVLESTVALAAGWPPAVADDAFIGQFGSGGAYFFKGAMCNVAVSHAALTADQLLKDAGLA